MYMFHMAKGDDICMVYDGSKSGLNATIYAPWFALPTAESMTRWVTVWLWLADNSYGECFLNFPFHHDLCKHWVGSTWNLNDFLLKSIISIYNFDIVDSIFILSIFPRLYNCFLSTLRFFISIRTVCLFNTTTLKFVTRVLVRLQIQTQGIHRVK